MGSKSLWVKEGETYQIAMWENTLVSVEIDTFAEIEIVETEPGFKGDTTTNTLKSAKLANDLEKRQNSIDDPEVLPKVTKEDIPKTRNYASPLTFANCE